MPRQTEENRAGLASFFGSLGFLNGQPQRVRWLRRWKDALVASEKHRRLEGCTLFDRFGLDEPKLKQVADEWRCSVVAESAGVDRGWNEGVA